MQTKKIVTDLQLTMSSSFKFAVCFALLFTVHCSLSAVAHAQGGANKYRSPLYSPRVYGEDTHVTDNGLPKALQPVGIEQRLNEQLPLDTKFRDENGQEVELGKYFVKGKPVVFALVYFECPMLCNEVLNGTTRTMRALSFDAGKEFQVVAVSFDARETSETARAKKDTYLAKYNREGAENGMHFLTGSQESIDRVTEAVGFNYEWDENTNQFAHAGAIMVATPEGKLARYFYGIEYAPKEVRLGIIEATNNKIGNPVDQLLLYCYHYNPATGKYGLAIMNVVRLGGLLTFVALVALIAVLWRYKNVDERPETTSV